MAQITTSQIVNIQFRATIEYFQRFGMVPAGPLPKVLNIDDPLLSNLDFAECNCIFCR